MTNAEIDAMKPGRALDVLVAQHLGWKWYVNLAQTQVCLLLNPHDRMMWSEVLSPVSRQNEKETEHVPRYSTDDTLALKMLGERCCELRRFDSTLEDADERGLTWEVGLLTRLPETEDIEYGKPTYDGRIRSYAPTLAHAFCLALLKTERA